MTWGNGANVGFDVLGLSGYLTMAILRLSIFRHMDTISSPISYMR